MIWYGKQSIAITSLFTNFSKTLDDDTKPQLVSTMSVSIGKNQRYSDK